MKDVVITGMGVVAPPGIGKTNFWNGLLEERSYIKTITRFDASRYPSRIAGEVTDLDAYSNGIPQRLLKKIDRFSHLALVSTDLAIKDARIDLKTINSHRSGIFIGNALGGWMFAETELRDLYLEGREGVSPYMASAWFPAAPQGQISIYYGIKGYSKTFVADRAGSLIAIGYAAQILSRRKLDIVFAGGTEAPITPYALLCCTTYNYLSRKNEQPDAAYAPFDKTRDGLVIGEGAGMLVLERLDDARKRGAPLYARLCGFHTNSDAYDRIECDPKGNGLAIAIEKVLSDAGFARDSIDYICADGVATINGDISETLAIKKVFGSNAKNIHVSAPKSMFGNLLGAQGSVDVITTVLSMINNIVCPTINYHIADPHCDLNYVPNRRIAKDINRALVISRGRGGINAVVALEKISNKNSEQC